MNNNRNDKEVLEYISGDLKERYSWISNVFYPDYEDYQLDLTLDTTYGEVMAEVKTSRGHEIKIGEDFNCYFSVGNPFGILRYSEVPEDMPKDKHVYMINASSRIGGEAKLLDPRCKFCEILKNQACLIYISKGGYLIWDYAALDKSFLGFVKTKCYHTEDFRKGFTQEIEYKALFAFEGAKWIKTKTIFN